MVAADALIIIRVRVPGIGLVIVNVAVGLVVFDIHRRDRLDVVVPSSESTHEPRPVTIHK